MTRKDHAAALQRQARIQLDLLGVTPEAEAQLRRQLEAAGPDLSHEKRCEEMCASLVCASPSDSGLVVASPSARTVASIYAVAAMIAMERRGPGALLEGQALLAEAVFIVGREAMRSATLEGEAAKRSADAKRGAPVKRFDDEALRTLRADWLQQNGHERGWKKHAAWALGVTERTVSARWKEISGSS